MTARGPLLVHVPTLGAVIRPNGHIVVTSKFVSGLESYARHWPGPVEIWVPPLESETSNLDNIELDPRDLPFGVRVVAASALTQTDLRQAGLIFAGLEWRTLVLAAACKRAGTPLVYGSEYTLKTRLQIAKAECPNLLRLARRAVWECNLERRQLRALAQAQGLQCNGTPTFEAYRKLARQPFLFFDSRTRERDLISAAALEQRLERLQAKPKLHLLFSGRWIEMKGVDQLPKVAAHLKRSGLDFAMKICGEGALGGALRRALGELDLGDRVELAGLLDFESELQPLTREWADLFICPHPQGDPSCTYLETLACGVPIAGYANEAWRGLLQYGEFGVATPVNDAALLAQAILSLAKDRQALARAARQARAFAAGHTFEPTFQRRVDHLREVFATAQRTVPA